MWRRIKKTPDGQRVISRLNPPVHGTICVVDWEMLMSNSGLFLAQRERPKQPGLKSTSIKSQK